ncbi:MAG: HsdR family type I site-specific deoxyribonuclease [Lentisphaerota bacterium]
MAKFDNFTAIKEVEYVEESLLRHLEKLGWTIVRAGDAGKFAPSVTYRDNFDEVFIEKELVAGLKAINPWLEENQIPDLIRELTATPSSNLIDANKWVLEKLIFNTSCDNHRTGKKSDTVRYIDFSDISKDSPGSRKNRYLAVSQFKVQIPGTEKYIIPDVVLFVNGLPLVVIECKSPTIADPIGEAVNQLLRYQNRRGEMKEGNSRLFWYNQILVATTRQTAAYSTITGEFEHFVEWKDPFPFKLSDIEPEGNSVTSQDIITQGMFYPSNLLDIIQSFTIFRENDKGKLIKIIPRYQQYRAVRKIINGLLSGKSSFEKGGTIWHTQGSGKSLTMMFVVRKMYREAELSGHKVVFITDRTDLEKQLSETARSIGYTINVAKKIESLKGYLRTNTPDLIMGMIHKFQEHEINQEFPVLNTSDKILVLIDEAHRGQYKVLGANLQKSLPHAVKIGFTGTPIEKTEQTFGRYIDVYGIREGVLDGVTVEIVYEGRTHSGKISDREAMNKRFEDVFPNIDDDQRKLILGKYTWRGYLEAEETVNDKAADMLDHYIKHILPNGFKAQVVVVSREAAVRYKNAFDKLIPEAISKACRENPNNLILPILQKLKAETVFSGVQNDPAHIKQYTNETDHERIIKSFKLPFEKTNEDGTSGEVGILIVQSMLLTGFDAPVEQVMYLDNVIKNHNLLQAIARVNRIEKNKNCGFVVDYVGIAKHLRKALEAYDEKDIDDTLSVFKQDTTDIDNLKYTELEIKEFVEKLDAEDFSDTDTIIDELADEEIRNDFISLLKKLTKAMDRVLPKPDALKYLPLLKAMSLISQTAQNRYRDRKFSLQDVSKKIRDIIDDYLIGQGVDPKIPPLPIFSDEFKKEIGKKKSSRAKAEELTHGIQEYINTHKEEDPELFERLSEKLMKLLEEYKNNWDQLAKELEALLEELNRGREGEETFGLDSKKEMPFLALLKKEIFEVKDLSSMAPSDIDKLINATKDIIERVKTDTSIVGFWDNQNKQKQLRTYIASHLLTVFNTRAMPKRKELSQKLLELTYHIYGKAGQ